MSDFDIDTFNYVDDTGATVTRNINNLGTLQQNNSLTSYKLRNIWITNKEKSKIGINTRYRHIIDIKNKSLIQKRRKYFGKGDEKKIKIIRKVKNENRYDTEYEKK